MVLAVVVGGLVAGDPRAEVDPLDEALRRQQVEDAVDRRDSDRPALSPQPVEELLGGKAAALPPEQLDDDAARAAATEALRPEGLQRPFRPRAHGYRIPRLADNDYR